MSDLVKFLLRVNYYYGRLCGIINFELDLNTFRARLSKKATIFAAIMNIFVLSLMPLIIKTRIWKVFLMDQNPIHEWVILMMLGIRIGCVYLTILSRWWQRKRLLQMIATYRHLFLQQPQVIRLLRRGVISKFVSGILTETSHMILTMYVMRGKITPITWMTMFMLNVMIGLLNVILSQFYFLLLTVHGHYILFNHELHSIVAETHRLEQDQNQDECNLKCGVLANRLDRLARSQSQLHNIVEQMTQIFGMQALTMCIIFDVSLIGGVYYSYSTIKYGLLSIDWLSLQNILLILLVVCFVVDTHITHSISYYAEDQHKKMVKLIAEFPTFAFCLDTRLEQAFESFQLQLVRNPWKIYIMGLFNVDRSNLIALFSSLISYSLILIQHDIKNYRNYLTKDNAY
ncbi:GH20781 [Drosophila grimshawi]|uniref:Gustatory receptor n=1 Tax=Drosophila grimshawi TaxID=7222 RepID=B4J698_DROGR|nr:GH20781 [Drosophila grimshawi]